MCYDSFFPSLRCMWPKLVPLSWYTNYSLRMEGETIKESAVRGHHIYKEVWSSESTETSSQWACLEWQMSMANDSTNSMKSSAMSDVFIVLFTFLVYFAKVILIGYLQSDPHSYYFHMLALTCPLGKYFTSPTPNFCLIRAVHFLSRI